MFLQVSGSAIFFFHCGEFVDGYLATPKRWRFVRGLDKPIHGIAIYFPGGISFFSFLQLMVNWWFGYLESPYERDSCLGAPDSNPKPPGPQTTNLPLAVCWT